MLLDPVRGLLGALSASTIFFGGLASLLGSGGDPEGVLGLAACSLLSRSLSLSRCRSFVLPDPPCQSSPFLRLLSGGLSCVLSWCLRKGDWGRLTDLEWEEGGESLSCLRLTGDNGRLVCLDCKGGDKL